MSSIAFDRCASAWLGMPPPRDAEPEHQMPPRILVVELDRAHAGIERALGELVDRLAGIEVEHAHIGPAEQRVGMGVFGVERERLEQQVLGAANTN